MVFTLRFSSSKCSLFHNSNVFGFRIIHILYTGCAKIKKNNSGAKRLIKIVLHFVLDTKWMSENAYGNISPFGVTCLTHR